MLEMEALQDAYEMACSKSVYTKKERNVPVPTKAFLQQSPDIDMLFVPFSCTHPPPHVPFPKDVAGSNIMNWKVCRVFLLMNMLASLSFSDIDSSAEALPPTPHTQSVLR